MGTPKAAAMVEASVEADAQQRLSEHGCGVSDGEGMEGPRRPARTARHRSVPVHRLPHSRPARSRIAQLGGDMSHDGSGQSFSDGWHR